MQKILRHCRPSFSWLESKCLEFGEDAELEEFNNCSPSANFVADCYR